MIIQCHVEYGCWNPVGSRILEYAACGKPGPMTSNPRKPIYQVIGKCASKRYPNPSARPGTETSVGTNQRMIDWISTNRQHSYLKKKWSGSRPTYMMTKTRHEHKKIKFGAEWGTAPRTKARYIGWGTDIEYLNENIGIGTRGRPRS